ncbi:MAG: DUF302 domain-containing protein [Pseudobdellovibrionaceae bacterium]
MSNLAISKETTGTVDQICEKVIEAIKPIGFGILTRIDFDQKIKEKLGENIPKTVILGACNPKLALEAFKQSTDVALLIPCNIVVRETSPGKVIIEAMRPTQMLEFLNEIQRSDSILSAEENLKRAILSL